jgi:hypothetical protein
MTTLSRFVRKDDGAALLTTVFLGMVLTALAATVSLITVNNVGNAGRDRQSSSALALSEGGVAQAVAHLRASQAIKAINACSPDCTSNPWGSKAAPMQVTVAPGETYSVWIEPLQKLDVAASTAGLYRVHSTGTSAGNPGNRTVQVDVEVSPFNYPLAVYADTVQPGGTGSIFNESLFSTGCIFKRAQINFGTELDVVYKVPPAAHSAQYITESQGSGTSCGPNDSKNIHHPSKSTDGCSTNAAYHYDQDKQGKKPVGAPCYGKHPATSTTPAYPLTSLIADAQDLEDQWNFQLEGLTAEQLEVLKAAAIEQGFYFTDTTAIPTVLSSATSAAPYPTPILFYDLAGMPTNNRSVDLNGFNDAYSRAWPLTADSPSCTGRAAFIVVRHGNVVMNSNTVLTASVFAMGPSPYGKVSKLNGTAQLIGTVYARELDLTGTGDIKLDECFVQNPPGQALEVRVTDFVEVDRPVTP